MKFNFKFMFAIFLIILAVVIMHEAAHYYIFETFGCNDFKVGIRIPYAYIEANCNNLTLVELSNLNLANSINEIVGYCILPFLIISLMRD